jgi:hypothetical protein
MSTQYRRLSNQEASPASLPPYSQETKQEEMVSRPQTFPQPPQGPPRRKVALWVMISTVTLVLILILSLGAILVPGLIQRPGNQVTPTSTPNTPGTQTTVPPTSTPSSGDTIPTPAPAVILGPQSCPSGVGDAARWNTIIGTENGTRFVEQITCANIVGNPSLQTLVLVRHKDANATADIYVFTNATSANPTQLFQLSGLVKGDAKISGYNTVMTAEIDKNSALNKGKPFGAMVVDLFREFRWSSQQKTLVQVAFPGIFPALTRYQAEADQVQVNKGQDRWKNDPVKVALAFETRFIDWQRGAEATLLSGGGSRDVNALVRVQQTGVQGAQILVRLSRLEGNVHNFWVVIAAENNSILSIQNIGAHSLITSPVTIEGIGSAFEAEIGQAVVYDHLYRDIGHARVTALTTGMGKAAYSTKVLYTSSFSGGIQEGIVAVYEKNGGMSDEAFTVVMVKVLLDPRTNVASGPLPCPDAVKDPAYWTPFVSAPPNPGVPEQVICGNLLGNTRLQALVIAREIIGGGPRFVSAFVFDNITDAKPKLLFKVGHLLEGDAKISSLSTIMTAEIDPNSLLNKGKPGAQMQVDLFREFQWSQKAGTFVQIAFPGIYPDLTRWQAETSQRIVNQGEEKWRLDAGQTTQKMLASLLRNTTSKVKLVSGGGSKDLNAVVDVTFPSPERSTSIPVTQVTLNRLGGVSTGVWEVTAVRTTWMFIYTPQNGATVTTPVRVTGFGPQFEAVIGTVYILDHLYQKIQVGDNFAMAPDGTSPPSRFSLDVKYTSSFRGAQEGVVLLVHGGGAEFDYGAVMVKTLISA